MLYDPLLTKNYDLAITVHTFKLLGGVFCKHCNPDYGLAIAIESRFRIIFKKNHFKTVIRSCHQNIT